jgi:HK97 family phage portal protein
MGLLDKLLENKLAKMGYGKPVKKMAGFMATEIENDPSDYPESGKPSDYKDFIDCFNALPWLYAGAMALAIAAPKPKLKIYQRVGEEQREILGKDINNLLRRPNPFLSYRELLQITVINMSIAGNHFLNLVGTQEKEPISESNKPVEIWWIKPEQIQIKDHPQKFIEKYVFTSSQTNKPIDLDPSEVIHLKLPNPDSYFRGTGAVQAAKNTAILELNATAYNKKFFENDAVPPFIFKFPEQMTEPQLNNFKQQWKELYQGPKNAGKLGYIFGDSDIKEIGKTPKDASYIEMRKMNREEVLACLPGSVPPSIVGLLEYANYSNMEVQSKKFWEDCVMPILDLIADKLTLNLAPHFDESYSLEFDYSNIKVLQEDEERRSKVAQTLVENAIKTPNQIRRDFYNAEPYEGGDQYFMKMSLIPVGVDSQRGKTAKALPEHKAKGASFWTEKTRKKALWENFVKRVEAKEKSYIPIAAKYIKRQARLIGERLKDVDDLASVAPTKLIEVGEETEKYIKDFTSWYKEMFTTAGEAGRVTSRGFLYDLETKGVFKDDGFLLTPELEEMLQRMIYNSGTVVNETLIDIIYRTLQRAQKEGWTVEEFRKLITHQVDEFSTWRSRLWARTETAKVENWGQLEGYKQSEFVEKKGWLCMNLPESRDSHIEADAQYSDDPIFLDELFIVGGEQLMYPGDGSAANACNCLCTTFPAVNPIEGD